MTEIKTAAPPRDNLYRAIGPADYELRDDSAGGTPTLTGHFAVFDQWTHINSMWEGEFMERLAPGAFKKTFAENRDSIKVLFQHGQDPQIGDKPLGMIEQLREDKQGAFYEVPLLDTSYNADLLPGLRAGLYGASFRFKVMRETLVEEPEASAANPHALPERTIQEAKVMEFGPVTFPAYAGATAGVRSLTDDMILDRFLREPQRFADLLNARTPKSTTEEEDAPSTTDAAPEGTSDAERRDTVKSMWPKVPREEWDELWTHRI